MRPEFYADLYRQFQTYVRNYGENRIHKIACGANAFDYNWTDKLMQNARWHMNALTLHYYTIPTGDWGKKGAATGFTTEEYYATLKQALRVEELLINQIGIMDRYDPDKRIGMIVDEWGTWYDVEPGTNPGFLYQQNTMRDAMVASMTFDIFHKFADRIEMTNIAQTINVLQAMVLTEGEKMVLTPTYHVYDLYKCHHDATSVYAHYHADHIGTGKDKIADFSATASVTAGGELNISMTNPSTDTPLTMEVALSGMVPQKASGRILHGHMGDHNRFEDPSKVQVEEFYGIDIVNGELRFSIPPCSVVTVSLS
jgi:alpha-N-arabinofuranosidase